MTGRDEPAGPGNRKSGGSTGGARLAAGGPYTHDDFTYVRRQRTRKAHAAGGEDEGELNIVPYLDIMINLIMFMLVAQTTVVSLGMIDVTAPTYTANVSEGAAPSEPKEGQLKRLTVGVARNGFYIAADGGVLPGESPESSATSESLNESQPPTIPLMPDGAYDFRALARKMRGVKNAFPLTEAVYLAADVNIPYEVIVATLDATREDEQGKLFPNVAFSQLK